MTLRPDQVSVAGNPSKRKLIIGERCCGKTTAVIDEIVSLISNKPNSKVFYIGPDWRVAHEELARRAQNVGGKVTPNIISFLNKSQVLFMKLNGPRERMRGLCLSMVVIEDVLSSELADVEDMLFVDAVPSAVDYNGSVIVTASLPINIPADSLLGKFDLFCLNSKAY